MDKRKKRAAKQKKRRAERQGSAPAQRLAPHEVDKAAQAASDAQANGDPERAEKVLRKALKGAPDHPQLLVKLAVALQAQGRQKAALPVAERLVEVAPDAPEAHRNLGLLRRFMGDRRGAEAAFRKALELNPSFAMTWFDLSLVKRFGDPADPDLAELERQFERTSSRAPERVPLGFALARAYDELGRYDEAFAHLERANRLERARFSYDPDRATALVDASIAAFDAEFCRGPVAERASEAAPILVFGLPRSGSTLVEQILASHTEVTAVGEVLDLGQVLRAVDDDFLRRPATLAALDADDLAELGRSYAARLEERVGPDRRACDKALDNYLAVGVLARALPNAKFVWAAREPVANCFSCYQMYFGTPVPSAYDLGEVARYHADVVRMMAHWDAVLPGRVLRVSYEDLVTEQEVTSRRLLEHCGLAWDDAVLRFHETERVVGTASATQVREKLYTDALERWRNYEAHLGPLFEALRNP